MKIDTVLFDLDGTLIDTTELILSSFTHTLEHYFPGQYTREQMIDFIGPPLRETFEKVDPNRVEELLDHYHAHNHAYHDELIKEYDGVYETVETLFHAGVKLGIVTTKMRKTTMMGLAVTKLDQFFETVVTMEDVTKVKPDPEPLQKAMAALNAKPENTIMVGDSHHDILGGKNARTKTAGVAWSIKGADYLRSYHPDYMLNNMRELLTIIGVSVS